MASYFVSKAVFLFVQFWDILGMASYFVSKAVFFMFICDYGAVYGPHGGPWAPWAHTNSSLRATPHGTSNPLKDPR